MFAAGMRLALQPRGRLLLNAIGVAILIVFVVAKHNTSEAIDAHIYWAADPQELYRGGTVMGDQDYHYSPAFAQAIAPLTALPFEAFQTIWLLAQTLVLAWLVEPALAALLLFLPVNVYNELILGNIHILLAAMIVLSFRWPGVWALAILTKVTPSVGILWYAARREWRNLVLALGVASTIAVASVALAPEQWAEWLGWLAGGPALPSPRGLILPMIPLPARLVLAAAIVLLAARADKRWILPIAVWLALPVMWLNGLAVLTAIIPLRAGRAPEASADRHPANT